MILPKPKNLIVQSYLWETPLKTHGQCRTVIGNFVERLTVERFPGSFRYRTDSRADYCPDLRFGSMFLEVKAAGKSKQTFVYAGRLLKDRDFAREHSLWYVVWHHQAATKEAATVEELERLVLAKMRAFYVVPFDAIDRICSTLREEKLNSNYGHNEHPKYGSGFRIPVKCLAEWMI